MRPLTAITGIISGSCFAIAVSLAAVLFVYTVLGDEYPRVSREIKPLLASMLIFFGMTAISAASFYTLLINHKFAMGMQLALWAGLAGTSYYYWP